MSPDGREYVQDIALLRTTLTEKHPDLYWQGRKAEIDRQFQELERRARTAERDEILLGLMKLFALIGDAHTQLYGYVPQDVVPLELSVFSDGACVTSAGAGARSLLGKRITRVAGIDSAGVLQRLKRFVTHENRWGFLTAACDRFQDVLVLRDLGLLDDADSLVIEVDSNGAVSSHRVQVCRSSGVEWMPVYKGSESDPLFVRKDQSFWTTTVPPGVLYFQFNEFVPTGSDGTSLEMLSHELADRFQASATRRLVIDLRHNSGGDFSVADPLVAGLRQARSTSNTSDIVVLIGRVTFSAAMLLAHELRCQVGAILLGEPTRARLNCYGNTHRLELESLGLVVLYSTRYFQLSETDQDAIYPDEAVEMTAKHFLTGVDPVMVRALSLSGSD